jgi:hypothetical protein
VLATAFTAIAPLEVVCFSEDKQALFVEVKIFPLQSAYGWGFIFFGSFQCPAKGLLGVL